MLSDIHQIMQDIWTDFLQLDIKHCDSVGASDNEAFVGKINIKGQDKSWEVILNCGRDASRAAAGAMFMAEPKDVPDDDIRETVAELTNMVGGNIKTLLPGHNTLSLPEVTDCKSNKASDSQGTCELLLSVQYNCGESPILIHVFQGEK